MSANDHTPSVEFRSIPGFPFYRVGSDGTVESCNRSRGRQWRPLRPRPRDGYLLVALYDPDGRRTDRSVHHLVLEAFVGPAPDGTEACHLDHNPANNRLDNLCWGTHPENMSQTVADGRSSRGEAHKKAILTEDQVAEIRRRAIEGETHASLAQRFGVRRGYISTLVAGRSWRHHPDTPACRDARATVEANRLRNIRTRNAKVTADQVIEIRRLKESGISTAALSREFGVARSTIDAIVNRRNWKDI